MAFLISCQSKVIKLILGEPRFWGRHAKAIKFGVLKTAFLTAPAEGYQVVGESGARAAGKIAKENIANPPLGEHGVGYLP